MGGRVAEWEAAQGALPIETRRAQGHIARAHQSLETEASPASTQAHHNAGLAALGRWPDGGLGLGARL